MISSKKISKTNKKMYKLFIGIYLTFQSCIVFSQTLTSENISQLNLKLFCFITPTDTIYFAKYDTVDVKKPLFLFIQGSLPMPLIIDDNGKLESNPFTIFNKLVFEQFNVVIISQPNTPPVVNVKNLNNQYSYIKSENPYDFDTNYMRRNVVETYVERANEVINCLINENLVYSDSIYVYGHSQGAYVTARLAASNENIKAIAFSATNPFGRYFGIMQEIRAKAIKGQMTEEEIQKTIEQDWNNWNYITYTPTVPDNWTGDLPATWISFSQPVVDILANLKQPVFVVYGTRDYHSVACELLPICFGFAKKQNYKMHPVLKRGHNFELIDDDGKRIWTDSKWTEVVNEFVKFIRKQE